MRSHKQSKDGIKHQKITTPKSCAYHLCSRKNAQLLKCVYCKDFFCDEHFPATKPAALGDRHYHKNVNEKEGHPCPDFISKKNEQDKKYTQALDKLLSTPHLKDNPNPWLKLKHPHVSTDLVRFDSNKYYEKQNSGYKDSDNADFIPASPKIKDILIVGLIVLSLGIFLGMILSNIWLPFILIANNHTLEEVIAIQNSSLNLTNIIGDLENLSVNQTVDSNNTTETKIISSDPKNIELIYYTSGKFNKIQHTVFGNLNDYYSHTSRRYYCSESACPSDEEIELKFLNELNQQEIIDELVTKIKNISADGDTQVRIATNMIQNIPYDYNGTELNSQLRYPYEVLYDNAGVCGEKSRLLALILKKLGYGAVLFIFEQENHEVVGIKCQKEYSYQNSGYCFIESTSPTIITYSEGTYVGGIRLTSVPKIYFVSDGKMFNATEDYLDARLYASHIKYEMGEFGITSVLDYSDETLVNLIKKYGIFDEELFSNLKIIGCNDSEKCPRKTIGEIYSYTTYDVKISNPQSFRCTNFEGNWIYDYGYYQTMVVTITNNGNNTMQVCAANFTLIDSQQNSYDTAIHQSDCETHVNDYKKSLGCVVLEPGQSSEGNIWFWLGWSSINGYVLIYNNEIPVRFYENCSIYENPRSDYCHYSLSKLNSDISFCDKISNKTVASKCRLEINLDTNGDYECQNEPDIESSDICNYLKSIISEKEGASGFSDCMKIMNTSLEQTCLSGLIFRDVLICKEIIDKEIRDDCYLTIAVKLGLDVCGNISSIYDRNNCYFSFATIKKDWAYCNKTGTRSDYCYSNIAKITENKDVCEYIIDSALKNICKG